MIQRESEDPRNTPGFLWVVSWTDIRNTERKVWRGHGEFRVNSHSSAGALREMAPLPSGGNAQ